MIPFGKRTKKLPVVLGHLKLIGYSQVVFTMPSKLSSLALGNRRKMYDLLFHSAWRALQEVVQEEQGFEAAAVMVLHTWSMQNRFVNGFASCS